jgi:hypothetical protein
MESKMTSTINNTISNIKIKKNYVIADGVKDDDDDDY